MPPAAQAATGVGSLVASIKQHKKFRQLASYSVQCLCKVITPPHVGWERNLKVRPRPAPRRAAPRRARPRAHRARRARVERPGWLCFRATRARLL